jgi:hypothetical protein
MRNAVMTRNSRLMLVDQGLATPVFDLNRIDSSSNCQLLPGRIQVVPQHGRTQQQAIKRIAERRKSFAAKLNYVREMSRIPNYFPGTAKIGRTVTHVSTVVGG